jgi:outer membrane receptor for ferrienterochelin and colicins
MKSTNISTCRALRKAACHLGLPLVVIASFFILLPISLCRAETAAADKDSKSDLLEMSVEELMNVEVATVVGASKYEQQVTEAPASVSIVSADDIKKFGYRTLADALRSVRGIYVTYDRNYAYLGVRGFNRPGDLNTRVLLLVDGHRINDNIYESAPIGTEFPVDVDLIDRIEVIRGPSSSLYGTNAFFGVVNVITKKPGTMQGTQVSGAAGSFGTFNGRVSYAKETPGGLGLLLSGSVMHSDGPDQLYFKEFAAGGSDGIARNADGDKNYQFFAKLSYRDFTLTGALASRQKTIPTASFGTVFNTQATRTTDGHSFLDLKYAHSFDEDTELTVRAFYDRYLYDGKYLYDRAQPGDPSNFVLNKDQAWGDWFGSEAQVTRTLFERNKVTAGLEYRFNSVQHQRNFDDAPFFQYLDDQRSSASWALYLQDEIRILDSLILSTGLRYDRYDSFGGTTNPRLALIYKPREGSSLKLLYGQAFRAPSAFEFYYSDGGQTTKANPDLKPERIRTYEAVYEQYFLKHYRSSLSGFYYRINDLISQRVDSADGLIQFENIDAVVAKGGELELEGIWEGGIKGRLSYTYQQVEDGNTGQVLTNSPRHLAKFNLVLPVFRDRVFLGVEEQYQSSRTTLAQSQTGAAYTSNATLSGRTPLPGLELSLSVYNLFDTRYGDPGAAEHVQDVIQQDGRSFRLKLDYHF